MQQPQALGGFLASNNPNPPRDYREPPEEEEMIEAERDLAEDAEWKRIQTNTFTRWANEHLKIIDKAINSLETDLSDGLALIALIEVLSQKKMNKHNIRPTFRSQKLENISVAMKFLEREGIKIINIDSTDIVDCKLKLILGLIWLLILHYSISMPIWEMDSGSPNDKQTPRQRLMNWVKQRVPDLPIHNFTTDWNDGKAIGALVDNVAPGLCPDWADWDPKDALQNATEAMGLADDWLGVPQLIKPEEMTNPKIDEQSMMTYLSQYPSAKLKQGAPVRPRTNPNSVPPPRVRCYGPGVEPTGPVVGAPANFTVETFSAGKGNVEVTVLSPAGLPEQVDVRFNNDKALTYSVSYIPKMKGPHKVIVKFGGRDVPKSPFTVNVDEVAGDASKVKAFGPGLQPDGVRVKVPTYFDIHAKDAGKGVPEVIILDPEGHKTSVAAKIRQTGPDAWRVEYTPLLAGLHSINIFYAGQPIKDSPVGVRVSPASDPKKVRAFGRGLQPTGVRVGDIADFRISTEGAGNAIPQVTILGPGGQATPFEIKAINNSTFDGVYKPLKEGRYRVMITYGGQEIPKSPFDVNVGPKKVSSIVAFGPGLSGGIVSQPATFVVETNGETGALGFSVVGPSQAKINVEDNGDGSALVTYYPTAPGEYAVHVLCDEEDIPKSPYMSQIILQPADVHPNKVKVYGKGVEPNGVEVGKKTEFFIDHKDAGVAPLEVKVNDTLGRPVPVQIVEKPDGTKHATYVPQNSKPHTVEVNFGSVAVPKSPFRVYVSAPLDPSKVQVFGPWVDNSDVKPLSPVHFIVDATEAGMGDLTVQVVNDATKQVVPINLIDNEDNTYTVELTPELAGTYTTSLTYGGLKVPFTKKTVISPTIDVSKVQVEGLEQSATMNAETSFQVDMTKLGHKIDTSKLSCVITDPKGKNVPSKIISSNNEVFKILYTPFEAGRHTIELCYDNMPVPGSPFIIFVKTGCDPSRCKASGPGLNGGFMGQKAKFTVSTREAGLGGLSFAIEGPSEAKMSCIDNRNGSCDVEFLPTEPGEYDISIKFADVHIPGSPFKVNIAGTPQQIPTGDYRSVKLYGPAVETLQVYEGIPASFFLNVADAGAGLIGVEMTSSEGGAVENYEVEERGDGNYLVTFIPPKQNTTITAKVTFAKHVVPGSPFVMKVLPPQAIKSGNIVMSGDISKKSLPASVPARFEIDTKAAGNGDVNVAVNNPTGKPVKPVLQHIGNGKYAVTFVPEELGSYNVVVRYAGKEIEGSPFVLQTALSGDANKCKFVQNAAEKVIFGKKNRLTVDAREAGQGNVTCTIKSQNGKFIDTEIVEKDGFFDIFYLLEEPGAYDVDVKFGGKQVPNGLMRMTAVEGQENFDDENLLTNSRSSSVQESSSRVKYSQEENVATTVREYRHTQTTVDQFLTTERSHGNGYTRSNGTENHLKIKHHQNGSSADHHRDDTSYHHTVDSSTTEGYRAISLNKVVVSNSIGSVTSSLEADVKMPSGKVDKPSVDDNRDGTVSIRYDPREEGLHEMTLKYNGEHVQGSPFKFHVDCISSGYVTAYGPGLTHGVTGEPALFTISTKGAGAGGLSMAVEGPSKAEINYKDNKDGTVSVNYLPTAPGEYKISVRFGDKNIKGSPFFAKVTGEGRKRNQISVGSCSEVTFPGKISDADLRSLNASIQAPSGLEEPCFLKRMPSGNIGISFTPREEGEHTVSVKRSGTHINNSPFKVKVAEREVGDAKKVKVSGKALQEGVTHADNQFSVDTRNAGYGGLSLSIEGPSKAEIVCNDKEDGTLAIAYKPSEPGYYIINLKFADHHVEGSPYTVKISGDGTNRKREKIQRQREAVPVTEVGSQCKLSFKMPGVTSFDLSSTVTSPGAHGVTEDAEVQEIDDGLYSVFFVPKELGIHTVSIRCKDMHIPGSPFQFTVGPLRDTGSHLVKAGGPGLDHGEQGQKCEFNVWTREAGGGTLAISVEGPSKADIDFKDRKDGSCDVSYVVAEPGDYRIGMKFNDRHIPDSPFKVYVSPFMGEAHKLEIAQFPSGAVQSDTPAQFIVRKNGAVGQLDAKVVAPSNTEDDCFIQLIDTDNYSVRFYPRENGIHAIHTKFNGVHIPGSPFRIKVGKDDADPAAVHTEGAGLHEGKTGQKADFIIDTCNAGAGTLAVTMDGPSKVSMDCTEVEEGYKVRYTPLLPGDYYCTIKYNHMHIVGSPFKIVVAGDKLADGGAQETTTVSVETVAKITKGGKFVGPVMPIFKSDASKVSAKGMGLKKAYLGKQNQFAICASGAGNNILYVGMYGPKGPGEEISVKHTGRNNYNVNYLVRERGDYILIVKWGDDHIPGSPFKAEV